MEFPETEPFSRRAAFFLAAEEYLAACYPADNYLFSWQIGRTVVMGRHQVAHQEINLEFCRKEGIDVIRRKSGGGCIFADEGNIMFSLVTKEGSVEPLFEEYAANVAEGLRTLGADVEVSGRNDIVLRGKGKICGNAFYHLPQRNIVHGTMLYDTDSRLMTGALTPPETKLKSAGVESVRSRIGLLKDCIACDIPTLRDSLHKHLCNRKLSLTKKDVAAIEEIEAGYYDPEYLYGHSSKATFVGTRRVEGCGHVEFRITTKNNLIEALEVGGDYFELSDAREAFRKALLGVAFTKETVEAALEEAHPERSIRRLSVGDVLDILDLHN